MTKNRFLANIIYSIYDPILLRFACPLIWKCKSQDILELYNKNLSSNHLDVGCGTGYFIKKCKKSSKLSRLVLTDLNKVALEISQKKLKRFNPEIIQHNILKPFQNLKKFDSIGLSFLIHCLPGDMKTKSIAFKNIAAQLNPKGKIFGATFIMKGTYPNFLTRSWEFIFGNLGFLHNKNDTLEGLEENLNQYFKNVKIKVKGHCAIFSGEKS